MPARASTIARDNAPVDCLWRLGAAFEAHPFAFLALRVDQDNAKPLKGLPNLGNGLIANRNARLKAANRHKCQAAFVRYLLHRHVEQGTRGLKLCWRHFMPLQISAG